MQSPKCPAPQSSHGCNARMFHNSPLLSPPDALYRSLL
jgi:hypothetical protein